MKKNMGTLDKGLRILVAVIIVALYYWNLIPAPLSLILLILAGIFLLTSLIGFCPLYRVFGVSTCKQAPDPKL